MIKKNSIKRCAFKNGSSLILTLFLLISCSSSDDDDVFDSNTLKSKIDIGNHSLQVYQKGIGDFPILFESGLADMANVWNEKGVFDQLSQKTKIISYDRAGYGSSDNGPEPRTIQQINAELLALLNTLDIKKVILVGHSLGGMFNRSFAVNHPERIAGLVFLDPSHEDYKSENDPGAQAAIDFFEREYGKEDIRYKEALQLNNTFDYVSSLSNLPDIPVTVITSIKEDENKDAADRQNWFDAHSNLATGVSNFTHIETNEAGHYVMIDKPKLVIEQVRLILERVED